MFFVGLGLGLGVGLFLAVSSAWVVYRRMSVGAAEPGVKLVKAFSAGDQLRPGTALSYEQVSLREIPDYLATPSIIRPEEMGAYLGRPVLIALQPGDLLYKGALGPPAATPPAP